MSKTLEDQIVNVVRSLPSVNGGIRRSKIVKYMGYNKEIIGDDRKMRAAYAALKRCVQSGKLVATSPCHYALHREHKTNVRTAPREATLKRVKVSDLPTDIQDEIRRLDIKPTCWSVHNLTLEKKQDEFTSKQMFLEESGFRFHGTSYESAIRICHEGWKLSKSNVFCLMGKGIYLTPNMRTAVAYARGRDERKHACVLVAHVCYSELVDCSDRPVMELSRSDQTPDVSVRYDDYECVFHEQQVVPRFLIRIKNE